MRIGYSRDWREGVASEGEEVRVETERGRQPQHVLLQHDHKEVIVDKSRCVCEQPETASVFVWVGEAVVHVDGRVAFS